jgi:hypothetical protein
VLKDGRSYTWKARAFDGLDYSKSSSPVQMLSFDSTPQVPEGVEPQDGDPATGTTNPALVGLYSDSNQGSGQLEFQVMDRTCSAVIASGLGTVVTSEKLSVWNPTDLGLVMGRSYGLRARSIDPGGSASSFSECSSFAIATTVTPIGPAFDAVSVDQTPMLTAKLGADAESAEPVAFEVHRGSDDALVASGTGAVAVPGQNSSWKVPAGILQAGTAYYWTGSAQGATGTGSVPYFVAAGAIGLTITSPLDGTAELDGLVGVTAVPTGFDSVSGVDFLVDGMTIGTDDSAPYSAEFSPQSLGGSHEIRTVATGSINGQSLNRVASVSVAFAAPTSPDTLISSEQAEDLPPSQGDPNTTETRGPVSTNRIVHYAERWTDNSGTHSSAPYNPAYKAFSADCANFVSQALHFGGWTMRRTAASPDGIWYYDRYGTSSVGDDSWAKNWINVVGWWHFRYWSHRAPLISFQSDSANRANDNVRPGDILVMDLGAQDQVDHMVIVTKVDYGPDGHLQNFYVSGHTNNRLNLNFWGTEGFHTLADQQTSAPVTYFLFRPKDFY